MRFAAVLGLLVALAAFTGRPAAAASEEFRVYTEHPRLFLRPQRLRLLRRERERQSMRWTQFDSLLRGGAELPEPALANALYFEVAGDNEAGRKAVAWALGSARDTRQLALVFDWCQGLLSEPENSRLTERLVKLLDSGPPHDLASARDRVLAAIAIADEHQDLAERALGDVIRQWWRIDTAPRIRSGALTFGHADLYPLFELIHAVRDNLNIDLREDAPDYFKALPAWYVTSFYPAIWPGAGNEFRIPCYEGHAPPDPAVAALARIGGFALVASDTNAQESQYVQGWLMLDRFILRDAFGAPYEFLWANPYQPGLSYAGLPLVFHDDRDGSLFVRSGWGDDAAWFGIAGREFQVFQNGAVKVLDVGSAGADAKPLDLGRAEIVPGRRAFRLSGADTVFVIGLKPQTEWDVAIARGEVRVEKTDRAGTLVLTFSKRKNAQVTLSERLATAQ